VDGSSDQGKSADIIKSLGNKTPVSLFVLKRKKKGGSRKVVTPSTEAHGGIGQSKPREIVSRKVFNKVIHERKPGPRHHEAVRDSGRMCSWRNELEIAKRCEWSNAVQVQIQEYPY